MVDFSKLRAARQKPAPVDPLEIFRRLPRAPRIHDLYNSQAEVLREWFDRSRKERDLVLKLHTGGGKTLVNLLIAQSILNETGEPVIYLAPTRQLVQQVLNEAASNGLHAVPYPRGGGLPLPEEFIGAKAVLVGTYQSLFNGRSKFGVQHSGRDVVHAAGIILDDAHVAFSSIRDAFTLSVTKAERPDDYAHLTTLFRSDFDALQRLGTFDDVVSGTESTVLEVPYWSWHARRAQVREYLRQREDAFPFQWPLIRDGFEYCHALISRRAFVLTPILPFVDLFPTYESCPRRVFSSATIADDSSIIRTFAAQLDSISKPITSRSLAGVGERMILSPELTSVPREQVPGILRAAMKMTVENFGGAVVIVPSDAATQEWQDVAAAPENSDRVSDFVAALQKGDYRGPAVFANRYDGIDLPDGACRLLIIDGLPRGMGEYDLFLASALMSGATLNSALAQRVEQGMGRASRGHNDHSVVVLTNRSLIGWMARSSNLNFLTQSTRAQLEIGTEVSRAVTGQQDFLETIHKCLTRDPDWVRHHQESLADLAQEDEVYLDQLQHAAVERKALQLARDSYYDKAVAHLEHHCATAKSDRSTKGWHLQLAARIAHAWNDEERAKKLQQEAFSNNRNLMRPQVAPPYVRLEDPGEQAVAIVMALREFKNPRGYLAHFDDVTAHLTQSASSNQFVLRATLFGSQVALLGHFPW